MNLLHRFMPVQETGPIRSLHPVTGMPLGHNEAALNQASSIAEPTRNLITQPLPHPVLPERLHSIETDEGEGLLPDIKSGYWERFKDFAGAEGTALVLSAAATAGMATITNEPALLLLAGPVIEKFGFAAWEIVKEAMNPSSDLSYPERVQKMLWGFFNNLKTDVLFHDIASYTPLMGLGLYFFPEVNPGLISGIAFGAGVFMAPKWEQLAGEGLHKLIRMVGDRKKLDIETYYEARYVLNDTSNPNDIFENIAEHFELDQRSEAIYVDTYYDNKVPQWSERELGSRDRSVYDLSGDVLYHRNYEVFATQPTPVINGEYTVFEVKKEKVFIPLTSDPDAAKKALGQKLYARLTDQKGETIAFRRKAAYNEKIRITLDIVYVSNNEAYYVIEFKGYPETRSNLYEAILHFKNKYGSEATIRSKNDIMTYLRNL